jgi:hypothetical protein
MLSRNNESNSWNVSEESTYELIESLKQKGYILEDE